MDFQEMALRMFPLWIFGLTMMFFAIKAGYKNVLKVDKNGLFNFAKFMFAVTIFRVALFKLFPTGADHLVGDAKNLINTIPLQGTLFVFWEDAVHTLPLIILFKYLNDSKIANIIRYVLIGIVMFAFGMGHTYQGYLAALALSFYIPYTIKLGDKYGVGTVMICHTAYDFTTLLTLKALLG